MYFRYTIVLSHEFAVRGGESSIWIFGLRSCRPHTSIHVFTLFATFRKKMVFLKICPPEGAVPLVILLLLRHTRIAILSFYLSSTHTLDRVISQ